MQGWRLVDNAHNVWGKEFGSAAPYDNDQGRWDMEPRSEQVFVDGRRCVHSRDDTATAAMPDFGFTATRTDPRGICLNCRPARTPTRPSPRSRSRRTLLKVRADHVMIDGFVFRRVNTYRIPSSMVTLHGEAIELRNSLLEYSMAGSDWPS